MTKAAGTIDRPLHDADDGCAAFSRRLEAADPEAFAEAFRRFYAPLVRYARRLTGSEARAGDAVQDVFLKLWERRGTLEVQVSLKALLYTMVRNRALNMNRHRRKIAPDVAAEEAQDRLRHNAAAGPSEMLEAEELRRYLYRWIDELPARRAEAFTLSRYHGLPHDEIADIMGVSKRTVDTHIYHALRDLRRRLDALRGPRDTP